MFIEASTYEAEQIAARILDREISWPGGAAVHRYAIETSRPGEPVLVHTTTNDDDDDGYPDGKWETWDMQFPDLEAALRFTGAECRIGISGVIVTVTLNGKEIR